MGHKRKFGQGDVPGYGAIFMSNIGTKKECFQRKLFGLPLAQSNFVLNVKKGMILFLFEFERRQLHGVFRATSNGEIDLEPNAFKSSGNCFPAQVPFTSVWNCYPLAEHEFKDAIRDNYFSWKKFKFGLSKDQVYNLMSLFRSKRISQNNPARTCLRYYDDKPAKRDTRFGNNRKKVRDRIKFIKEENGHCHGFDIDEVKQVDDQGYRTLLKERASKVKKEVILTNCIKESYDFGDGGSRKLDKCLDRSLGDIRREKGSSLHFMRDINNSNEMRKNFPEINGIPKLEKVKCERDVEDSYRRFGKIRVKSIDENFLVDGIANKRKCFRDDNRIQDEYHGINGFREKNSAWKNIGSPDEGSQPVVDGWFFRHGTVESQQRTLTDHPLSKPKGVTDVCQSPNYEPRTSPLVPRGTDFGIKLGFDEEHHNSLSNSNQNNSDFIPILEASGQFQHPFEFNNIENTYAHGFPSVITMHTPYDPEVPEFCHRCSYFAPGPVSSPIDNLPSETIPYESERKCVHKVGVYDRLTSAPKAVAVNHEQEHQSDEKTELDATVNNVMKMLEKIVSSSSPINRTGKMESTFEQDDDDNKIVDYELLKRESEVDIKYEGIEGGSVVEETRVVDYKRHKKANKNLDDEIKEGTPGNTSGTDSDVGVSCKRKRLVRPVFESIVKADETTPLKVDCCLTKAVERLENTQGEKSRQNENGKNCQVWGKQGQENCGFDEMVRVDSLKDDGKMCGWIEE